MFVSKFTINVQLIYYTSALKFLPFNKFDYIDNNKWTFKEESADNTSFIDDHGYFLDSPISTQTKSILSNENTNSVSGYLPNRKKEQTLYKVDIYPSTKDFIINRRQTRVQDLIANITGLGSIIQFIVGIVVDVYNSTMMNLWFMNKVFDNYEDENENELHGDDSNSNNNKKKNKVYKNVLNKIEMNIVPETIEIKNKYSNDRMINKGFNDNIDYNIDYNINDNFNQENKYENNKHEKSVIEQQNQDKIEYNTDNKIQVLVKENNKNNSPLNNNLNITDTDHKEKFSADRESININTIQKHDSGNLEQTKQYDEFKNQLRKSKDLIKNNKLHLNFFQIIRLSCCKKYLNTLSPKDRVILNKYETGVKYCEERTDILYLFKIFKQFDVGKRIFIPQKVQYLFDLIKKPSLPLEEYSDNNDKEDKEDKEDDEKEYDELFYKLLNIKKILINCKSKLNNNQSKETNKESEESDEKDIEIKSNNKRKSMIDSLLKEINPTYRDFILK